MRYIKDSIHNQISFRNRFWDEVIDTLEFQRLREIKQLGVVYYVFPGAIHTRFEHSLGVGYMAQTMMEHFLQNQKEELAINDRDKDIIVMAGLCNDLG